MTPQSGAPKATPPKLHVDLPTHCTRVAACVQLDEEADQDPIEQYRQVEDSDDYEDRNGKPVDEDDLGPYLPIASAAVTSSWVAPSGSVTNDPGAAARARLSSRRTVSLWLCKGVSRRLLHPIGTDWPT